jgi:cobalt-zinc-cadmium efflux system protein
MIADAASSIGIVIVAFIIMATEYTILDPIVSFGISAVILYWSWGILKDSTRILLEMAPKGMDIDTITEDIKSNFPEILELFDAHLWTIIPNMLIYSAHVKLNKEIVKDNYEAILIKINDFLSEKFNILESTIQIMPKDAIEACNI